jgi:hypothetical protein
MTVRWRIEAADPGVRPGGHVSSRVTSRRAAFRRQTVDVATAVRRAAQRMAGRT